MTEYVCLSCLYTFSTIEPRVPTTCPFCGIPGPQDTTFNANHHRTRFVAPADSGPDPPTVIVVHDEEPGDA